MRSVAGEDYYSMAMQQTREAFVATNRGYFLLNEGQQLKPPPRPQATMAILKITANAPTRPGPDCLILAVRKTRPTPGGMITVGRTGNNDIVLQDVSVTKFHAAFKEEEGRITLADAGSRNGTTVDGRPLPPRGDGEPLESGNLLRFGNIELRFLDAGGLWDALH